MGRCSAVFVGDSLLHRHAPSVAACRSRPWCAALAGSMLLDRLDAACVSVAFAPALARRALVRCPHDGTRSSYGAGSAPARRCEAGRRLPLGNARALAQTARKSRAECLDCRALAHRAPCAGRNGRTWDRAVDLAHATALQPRSDRHHLASTAARELLLHRLAVLVVAILWTGPPPR